MPKADISTKAPREVRCCPGVLHLLIVYRAGGIGCCKPSINNKTMTFCANQSGIIAASEIGTSNALRPVSLLVIQGLKQALAAMHGIVSLAFILEDRTRRRDNRGVYSAGRSTRSAHRSRAVWNCRYARFGKQVYITTRSITFEMIHSN